MCNGISKSRPVHPASNTSQLVPSTAPKLLGFLPLQVRGATSTHPDGVALSRHRPSPEMSATAAKDKSRPKRRRKPQKPGKTAKMNDRHFVVHNYHDHANDKETEEKPPPEDPNQRRRGGVSIAFPIKLHTVLERAEANGIDHVISWQPHGRCFVVHKPKEFVDRVMPEYFRQTKLTSFQRQLNLYGFNRLTRGGDRGGYYHELFLRGKAFLCKRITRTKVKGTKFKATSSPECEPDFYAMPPAVGSPPNTATRSTTNEKPSSMGTQNLLTQRAGVQGLDFQLHGLDPQHPNLQSIAGALSRQQRNLVPPIQVEPHPPSPYVRFSNNNMLTSSAPPTLATAAPIAPSSLALLLPPQPLPPQSDVDHAVNELFPHLREESNISDFVRDWDPTNFGESLQDDSQLGFMLEKLLEE